MEFECTVSRLILAWADTIAGSATMYIKQRNLYRK
jgi:hypothetical protein